jgi:epoxyqueuosine reductase
MRRRKLPIWQPSREQMQVWPHVSGNSLNGVGEVSARRPSPIYWHPPDSIPHGKLQPWFYARTSALGEGLLEARRERQRAIDEPLASIAVQATERSAAAWSEEVKQAARAAGADDIGITAMLPEYVFEGHAVPTQRWMIVIAVAQDYDAMATAPSVRSLVEITRQYARGTRTAKAVANWLRSEGYDALPYGGPMAGSFLLIPPAIRAGLGDPPDARLQLSPRVRPHRRAARAGRPRRFRCERLLHELPRVRGRVPARCHRPRAARRAR